MEASLVSGKAGRVFTARLLCNDDLVASVEELCATHRIGHAFIKGGLGSLFRAQLEQSLDDRTRIIDVQGFAVELLSISGQVLTDASRQRPVASLYGIVADNLGAVYAGKFVRGSAPTCITIELMVQEWLPCA
ncbi:PPC domain-containing DNA-binding protein [Pollutimonas bauzanensis]|uniref:Predicted DNA-binding protein with PD1-like DNA-binding motif n=1 Tax=Pollutimonas bauzanensis TaxID=658167 RepID=A0A1M5X3M7_9BURK|nr:PPC domain-containing DNA-binding protein [Pollutimonas bauzanensis]SHH94391.1 Predicted DNA-binding protein with PD1-like DNA-binding motif [Pollutimonas bauzanensis]